MTTDQPYEERELLVRISEGDEAAFHTLYTQYWGKIYANALKFTKAPELAKDLAQDVFVKLWVKREKLATVEQFAAYLYRVARNVFYDHFSQKVFDPSNAAYLDIYFQGITLPADTRLQTRELESHIESAIRRLPVQVRTAFELSRKEGLSHDQIAEKMGISRITSKSYISRALLSIRAFLEQHPDKGFLLLLLSTLTSLLVFFHFFF